MGRPTLVDKVKAMAALACIEWLSPAGLKVGLRLLHHYNCKTARCDPSTETLAKAIHYCERTIFRAVSELEERGLFEIHHRRGRGNTNAYVPNFKRIGEAATEDGQTNSANLTSRAPKPDNPVPEKLTARSGEHMKQHMNQPTARSLHSDWRDPIGNQINFARHDHQRNLERDAMAIDWASWDQWLRSIGICNGFEWFDQAIERARSEAKLDLDEASLLIDRCLRKFRATSPKSKPLDVLVTHAIASEKGKQRK